MIVDSSVARKITVDGVFFSEDKICASVVCCVTLEDGVTVIAVALRVSIVLCVVLSDSLALIIIVCGVLVIWGTSVVFELNIEC